MHITVVEPRVSTDESFFIRACLFAIRCTPIASARVTVGSMPSGTNATIIPIAKTKDPINPILIIVMDRVKKSRPTPTAIYVKSWLALLISL